MANTVRIVAQLRDEVSAKMHTMRGEFDKLAGSRAYRSIAQGVGIGVGINAWNMLGSAVGQAGDFMVQAARNALNDEQSVRHLTTSLDANIKGWRDHNSAIESAITAGMRLGFTDEQTRESLGLLAAATHDVERSTRMLGIAQDFARFRGISLQDATTALVRTEGGQYRMLAALGLRVKDFASQEEVLAAVQAASAGQAEAYANSTAGAFAELEIQVDELQERIGYALVPVLRDAAEGLNALFAVMDGGERTIKEQTQDYLALLRVAALLHPELNPIIAAIERQTQAMEGASQATGFLVGNWKAWVRADEQVAEATKEVGEKAHGAARQIPDFYKALEDVSRQAQDTRDSLEKLGDTFLDNRYDATIAAGRMAELRERIADLKGEQKEYTAGSDDWLIVKGNLAEARKELEKLEEQQAIAAGDATYAAWLQAQIDRAAKAGDNTAYWRHQLELLLGRMKDLSALGGSTQTPLSRETRARQHGGPVWPGQWTVGEAGPERLTLGPGGVGMVTPLGGRGSGGEPMTVITKVVLDGREIARQVDRYQHYSLGLGAGTTART